MKKRIFIIGFAIFMFVFLIYYIILFFDVFHTMPIVSLNNLSATQYEEKTDISYIKNIKYGRIVSASKKIDTSTPGKKKVVIKIKNDYGKIREYQFFVDVKEKNEV